VDAIVHAATDPRRADEVDVRGTERLLDAAHAAGIRHLVYVSIVGIDEIPVGITSVSGRPKNSSRAGACRFPSSAPRNSTVRRSCHFSGGAHPAGDPDSCRLPHSKCRSVGSRGPPHTVSRRWSSRTGSRFRRS
jgi:hypothetical protein